MTVIAAEPPPDPAAGERGACAPGGVGVALQVLGSGGPIADDPRASAGYLLWVDGHARALVDAGGGVFLNFARSGADFGDLRGIALSHLHVDHSVDLPALLKSAFFAEPRAPLPVLGPGGPRGPGGPADADNPTPPFPDLGAFLGALFGPQGAYPYLGWVLVPDEGPFVVVPEAVDPAAPVSCRTWDELEVCAVGVPHGPVPALGLRLGIRGIHVAFAGDQRLDDPRFPAMIAGADLLVAHHAIPEASGRAARSLHATPSVIGEVAAAAGVGHLVLAHHMVRATLDLEGSLAAIRRGYTGPLTVAADLTCVVVTASR